MKLQLPHILTYTAALRIRNTISCRIGSPHRHNFKYSLSHAARASPPSLRVFINVTITSVSEFMRTLNAQQEASLVYFTLHS